MIRSLIKSGTAAVFSYSGANQWLVSRGCSHGTPLILGYHRVVEDFRQHSAGGMSPMLISLPTLSAHLDWLGNRYEFVSLRDLPVATASRPRKPAVAITFDDGYSDVYHHALPLFRRKGIPFAVFVVTDMIGTGRLQAHDEVYMLMTRVFASGYKVQREVEELMAEFKIKVTLQGRIDNNSREIFLITRQLLKMLRRDALDRLIECLKSLVTVSADDFREYRCLDWGMLAEMQRADVTIGSHTRSHALLPNETRTRMFDEARGSRQLLEARLGTRIEHFAYPDGRFNRKAVEAVAAAGYRYAYTTTRFRDSRYPNLTVPRRILWEKSCAGVCGRFSPSLMSCQVSGIFDLASHHRSNRGALT